MQKTWFRVKGFAYLNILFFIWVILLLSSCHKDKKAVATPPYASVIKENYGITRDQRVLSIILEPASESKYFVVENPHVNKIIFSRSRSNDSIVTGDMYPYGHRKINNRFFIFQIDSLIRRDTIRLVFDKSGENLSYTLRVMGRSEFESYERNDNLAIGLLLGFYSLGLMLSVLLFFHFRSIKILLFVLYIFFSLLWILNDAGILYKYLWPNSPAWHNSTRGFLSSLTIILFALYIKQNENKMFNRNIKRFLIIIIFALAIKLFITVLLANGLFPEKLKYVSSHLNALTLLFLFASVFVFILSEIRKHQKDLFEMLAILSYCSFVISLSLKELGFSHLTFENIHQLQALPFFLMQLLFMSIHLFKTEMALKRERELAFIEFKINQQKETDKKILEVEEKEKKRIAQNIHDEIGGIFVAIKYLVLSVKEKNKKQIPDKELTDLINLSNLGLKKQYSIIDDLLFEINDQKTFQAQLKEYLDMVMANQGIRIDLKFDANEKNWSALQKSQLFRVLMELVTNTIKHAQASVISVQVSDFDKISLIYFDNGPGFDIQLMNDGKGLKNIRTRINELNGQISFINRDGNTIIEISIPLNNG